MKQLLERIDECALRLRRLRLVEYAARSQFWLLVLLSAAVIAERLSSVSCPVSRYLAVLGGAAAASALFGLVRGYSRKPDRAVIARMADVRLGLKERVSSALEIAESGSLAPSASAVLADTRGRLGGVHPEVVIPWRWNWQARALLPALGSFLLLAFFLPEIDLRGGTPPGRTRGQDRRIADRVRAIKRRAARIKEVAEKQDLQEVKKLADHLLALASSLEHKPDEKKLLAGLNTLKEDAKKLRDRLQRKMPSPDKRALQQVSSPLAKSVAQSLMRRDFASAAAQLNAISKAARDGELSEQQAKELAKSLRKMAEAMKDSPQTAEALKNAADQLENGDMSSACQNLAEAAQELNEADLAGSELAQVDQILSAADATSEELGHGDCCSCCGRQLTDEERATGMCSGCAGAAEDLMNMGDGQLGAVGKPGDEPRPGEGNNVGGGMGNRGHGMGGDAGADSEGKATVPWKPRAKISKGKILSIKTFRDVPKSTDELVDYRAAYLAGRTMTENALSKEPVPLAYKELVKEYFDSISPTRLPPVKQEKKAADQKQPPAGKTEKDE